MISPGAANWESGWISECLQGYADPEIKTTVLLRRTVADCGHQLSKGHLIVTGDNRPSMCMRCATGTSYSDLELMRTRTGDGLQKTVRHGTRPHFPSKNLKGLIRLVDFGMGDPRLWLSRPSPDGVHSHTKFKDRASNRIDGKPARTWKTCHVLCPVNCGWDQPVNLRCDRNSDLYPEDQAIVRALWWYHMHEAHENVTG